MTLKRKREISCCDCRVNADIATVRMIEAHSMTGYSKGGLVMDAATTVGTIDLGYSGFIERTTCE